MLTVGTGSIWAAGKRQRDRLICPPDLSSRAKEDCCPLDCSKVMLVELPMVCLELALLACGLPSAVRRSLLDGIDGCLDSLQSVEFVRARESRRSESKHILVYTTWHLVRAVTCARTCMAIASGSPTASGLASLHQNCEKDQQAVFLNTTQAITLSMFCMFCHLTFCTVGLKSSANMFAGEPKSTTRSTFKPFVLCLMARGRMQDHSHGHPSQEASDGRLFCTSATQN